MDNKEKAIKLINAIFAKVWNHKYPTLTPMEVTELSGRVLTVDYTKVTEMDKDLAAMELFGICDDIHSTAFFGVLLIPDRIDAIETPTGYLFRSDYEVTDEMIEKVLNDPIFDED